MHTCPDDVLAQLRKNFRSIRILLQFSQEAFALRLGIPLQILAELENGRQPEPIHAVAVLAVIDCLVRKNSVEYSYIQQILEIEPEKENRDSFLACWLALVGEQEKNSVSRETASFPCVTMQELIDRSDKIYLFYDFLLRKESLYFLNAFMDGISCRRKVLPLLIYRSHLKALLASRTPENEQHILDLYEYLTHMKKRNLLFTKDSGSPVPDCVTDYLTVCSEMASGNFFASVLTEHALVSAEASKNCLVYSWDSFTDLSGMTERK